MRKPGWDPTRRNRKTGTKARGHGRDNRFVIPRAWPDNRIFFEVLRDVVPVLQFVHDFEMTFLVEPTTAGFVHPVTLEDVVKILHMVPPVDLDGIDLFIWRQPTRKQRVVSSVWGRMVYCANTGQYNGGAIYLEAQNLDEPISWSRSLTPEYAEELARLRADGHRIQEDKREYRICPDLSSARSTQLFRTVLHEIGHNVDYLRLVDVPGRHSTEAERAQLAKRYFERPEQEREAFAHRYADDQSAQLHRTGQLPFARNTELGKVALSAGIEPQWFGLAR